MSQLEKKYMLYFELHTKYKDDCCNKKINTISYVSIGFLDIYDDEQELYEIGVDSHETGVPMRIFSEYDPDGSCSDGYYNYYIIKDFPYDPGYYDVIKHDFVCEHNDDDSCYSWLSDIPTITYSEVLAKGWVFND